MHMKQNVKSDGRKDSPIHDSVSVLLGRVVVVGGGGGYSHILTIRVCAAVQGMVFQPFCQEQDIENTHFKPGFHIIAPVATVATVANKIIQRQERR